MVNNLRQSDTLYASKNCCKSWLAADRLQRFR